MVLDLAVKEESLCGWHSMSGGNYVRCVCVCVCACLDILCVTFLFHFQEYTALWYVMTNQSLCPSFAQGLAKAHLPVRLLPACLAALCSAAW